jgi:hypothetical protein
MEALILVATHGSPTMFERIGVMQALNRHHVREFNTDRKPITRESESSRGTNDSPDLRQHEQASRRSRTSQGISNVDAAEKWFEENDPEGVAFE